MKRTSDKVSAKAASKKCTVTDAERDGAKLLFNALVCDKVETLSKGKTHGIVYQFVPHQGLREIFREFFDYNDTESSEQLNAADVLIAQAGESRFGKQDKGSGAKKQFKSSNSVAGYYRLSTGETASSYISNCMCLLRSNF